MKVDYTAVKPAFVPITITLETAEELAFFRDVVGSTYGAVSEAYGVTNDAMCAVYNTLNNQCELQHAPGYKTQGYTIKFEATNKGE